MSINIIDVPYGSLPSSPESPSSPKVKTSSSSSVISVFTNFISNIFSSSSQPPMKPRSTASDLDLDEAPASSYVPPQYVPPPVPQVSTRPQPVAVSSRSVSFSSPVVASKDRAPTAPISREAMLLQRALSSTATRELYNEARAKGKIDIRLVPSINSGGSMAITYPSIRRIDILSSLSFDLAFTLFVFELTNMIQAEKLMQLTDLAESRQISSKTFALRAERIEYEGCRRHHEVMQKAIKEMGWSEELDIYKNSASQNFEEHLKLQGRHTEQYKQFADSL